MNTNIFLSKKFYFLIFILFALIFIGISIWYSGKAIWSPNLPEDKKEWNAIHKYNKARDLYRENKLEDATQLWSSTTTDSTGSWEVSLKSLYNLGNSYFEQATNLEKEGKLQNAMDVLKQSLAYYRDVLDQIIKENNQNNTLKTDTAFNFEITRRKIKILEDQLKQQQKDQEDQKKQKNIYELAKQILEEEKQLEKYLETLKQLPDSEEKNQQIKELLKRKENNLDQFRKLQKHPQLQTPKNNSVSPKTPPSIIPSPKV